MVLNHCIWLHYIGSYLISKIVKNGQVIFEEKPKIADPNAPDRVVNGIKLEYVEGIDEPENSAPQVLSHKNAFIVGDMMSSVIYGGHGISGNYWGTGGRAKVVTGREDLHGKTGTTNNVHDAWFSGFNGDIVATSWMGFDSDKIVAALIMLGAPTTATSYIMSRSLGHEGVLSASIVVLTTLLSAFTITGWVFVLRSMGYI